MANQYGIDLAGVEGTVSALKTAKLNRQIKEEALKSGKEDRTNRLAQIARTNKNVLSMASNTKGMEGYDVKTATDFDMVNKFLTNADTKQKQAALQTTQTLGKYSMAILNSQDPQQKQTMWEEIKMRIPPNIKGDMPDKYDENWLILNATKAKKISDMIKENINKQKNIASQNKIKSEYVGKERVAKLTAKLKQQTDAKSEKQKQADRIAFEKIKAKAKARTAPDRRLKLQKLFDLRNSIAKTDPTNPDLEAINKAIKLASEGKPSEMDKFLAMQLGVDETTNGTDKTTSGDVTDKESFSKKWGF